MKAIFADSFYYFALLNPDDEAHANAREFSAAYSGRIVNTAWVLTEVADGLSGSRLRRLFAKLLEGLEADPRTSIMRASDSLFREGIAFYLRRSDKNWSLTDCISFVAMHKRGLDEAHR